MIKSFLKHFRVVKKEAFLAIFFILLETILETLVPFMNAQIVDVGIKNQDFSYILLWGGLMVLCAGLAFLVGNIGVRYVAATGQGVGAEVRRAQFEKIQGFDAENRDKFATSSLITRLTNDTYTIQNTIITGMRGLFRAPFMIAMVLVLSFMLNKEVAFVFLVVLPLVAFLMFLIVLKSRPIYKVMQERFDDINRILQENFQAIRVVKAYVSEDQETTKFNSSNETYRHYASKALMTVSFNNPFMQIGLYTAISGILFFGGTLVNNGQIQVGEITGLLTYVLQLMNALLMVAQLLIMFSRATASVSRVNELLAIENKMHFNEVSEFRVEDGVLKMNNVSFNYPSAVGNNVLNNITLELTPGKTLGIIGQTGSGKSTLVSLLGRLYDVSGGEILIDNHHISSFSKSDLAQTINIVFQNNMLFSGSILSNLEWGNQNMSEEELNRALSTSLSDEIVAKLKDGLESEVGQAGSNLSGGQKQRVALARALLRNPKVLILDDALSAIDTVNEAKIRKNLRKFYPKLSLIIVSQRISAIKNADHIIVMHEGRIHGEGSHSELLENDEIYRDIYETQLQGAAL